MIVLPTVQCETVLLCAVVLTAHIQLVPSLRISGTVPPSDLLYGFYGVYRVRFPLVYLHYTVGMYVFCVYLRTNSHYFLIQH